MSKSKSYAEQISDAQTMTMALGANLDALEKRGMSEEFVNSLGSSISKTVKINIEQERLKGELKSATAALDAAKQQLHAQMSEAVKVVKLGMPQERWVEFGITGKR